MDIQKLLTTDHAKPIRDQACRRFEISFIYFKPFIQISGRNISEYEARVSVYDAKQTADSLIPKSDSIEALKSKYPAWPLAGFRPQSHRTVEQALIDCLICGKAISWFDIAKKIDFQNVVDLLIALESIFLSIDSELINEDTAARLNQWSSSDNVFFPSDNVFDPFEARVILKILRSMNIECVIVSHELFSKIGTIDLKHDEFDSDFWMTDWSRITDENYSFLFHTEFDDHFSFFHGPAELKNVIYACPDIEGFFCNEKTTHRWWQNPSEEIGRIKKLGETIAV